MKGFFKEKLRSIKPRKGNKVKVEEVLATGKKVSSAAATTTGYSHLDCCADVPYNLAEEPEQVDTNKGTNMRRQISVDTNKKTNILTVI